VRRGLSWDIGMKIGTKRIMSEKKKSIHEEVDGIWRTKDIAMWAFSSPGILWVYVRLFRTTIRIAGREEMKVTKFIGRGGIEPQRSHKTTQGTRSSSGVVKKQNKQEKGIIRKGEWVLMGNWLMECVTID